MTYIHNQWSAHGACVKRNIEYSTIFIIHRSVCQAGKFWRCSNEITHIQMSFHFSGQLIKDWKQFVLIQTLIINQASFLNSEATSSEVLQVLILEAKFRCSMVSLPLG